MSNTRLQGLETEYGFAVLPVTGEAEMDHYAFRLVGGFPGRIPCLPAAHGNGWFLANGARAYVDAGAHPEFCTPEVDNPFDAVRYLVAGDRWLEELAEGWSTAQGNRRRMFLFKSNVDYLVGSTWACHESYSHRADPRSLPRHLIPHLVSRILYTGAGGLNPTGETIQFCLCPRAHHLIAEVSSESTSGRGIFHNKDESLAGPGWHRLHVLAGESLCSHRAAVLKLGTTALVLALAEAGLRPGDKVQLAHPLEALRVLNLDPQGRTAVPLQNGGQMTGLDLQRHYLALAQAHLGHAALPPWAARICQLWQDTLEQLERGPEAVAGQLDWAIKFTLYGEHLRQRHCDPAQLERWNRATTARPRPTPPPRVANMEALLEILAQHDLADEPLSDGVPNGITPEEAGRFRQLRAELAELEIRFGQLAPGGLFRALDAQGRLDHRLPDEITDEGIRRAMTEPPARGRARIRGNLVRQLSGGAIPCACEWHFIRDANGRFLDLTDPFLDQAPAWQVQAAA